MANRKLIMFNMLSLDGFFCRPQGELDFHRVDDEFRDFAVAQLDEADGLLFGRKTYELMAAFWPKEQSKEEAPVASRMNAFPKYVYSRTLKSLPWENCRLMTGNPVEEIGALKKTSGKSILILGSGNLSAPLIDAGLVDEFRFMISPVAVGKGRTMFEDIKRWKELRLLRTRTFGNGNVLLSYVQ